MTKQSKITATNARFPLAALTLSPMNPRQDVPEKDVVALAESIWAAGLIQTIAGLADDAGGAEIVAGGRRLRALKHLAKKQPQPCNHPARSGEPNGHAGRRSRNRLSMGGNGERGAC